MRQAGRDQQLLTLILTPTDNLLASNTQQASFWNVGGNWDTGRKIQDRECRWARHMSTIPPLHDVSKQTQMYFLGRGKNSKQNLRI